MEARTTPAAGDIDTTFGLAGFHALGSTVPTTAQVSVVKALPSDGRDPIHVGGSTNVYSGGSDFFVARVSEQGNASIGFNGGNPLTFGFDLGGGNNDTLNDLTVADDYRVVAVGSASTPSNGTDFAVARLTDHGQLDGTFGVGGKATVGFDLGGNRDDVARAVFAGAGPLTVVGTARVTVGGYYDPTTYQYEDSDPNSYNLAFARFDPYGQLDATYGTGGKITLPVDFVPSYFEVYGGTTVLVAGRKGTDAVIARYTEDGTLDPSFGIGGRIVVPNPSFYSTGASISQVVPLADGRLLLVAGGQVYRVADDATLDTTFGTNGSIAFTGDTVDPPSDAPPVDDTQLASLTTSRSKTVIGRVTVQPDGEMVASGGVTYVWEVPDPNPPPPPPPPGAYPPIPIHYFKTAEAAVVARFTADGQRDTTFGAAGGRRIGDYSESDVHSVPFPDVSETVTPFDNLPGVGLEGDGRIVTAGLVSLNGASNTSVVALDNTHFEPPHPPTISDVPDQSVAAGGTLGPIAFTVSDAQFTAADLTVTATTTNAALFPAGSIVFTGSGANRAVTLTPAPGVTGTATVTLTVKDPDGNATTDQFTVVATSPPPSPPPSPPASPPASPPPVSPLVGGPMTVVGSGHGMISVLNPDGSVASTVAPFAGFTGDVRTASGANGQVVAATGPGTANAIRVLNPTTGETVLALNPFEASFAGGLFVSTGDIAGTGTPDVIVSPDEGGGPRVQIRNGITGAVEFDFFGIDDPNFRGGARTAVSDATGDGVPDLIVAAGFGGGPRVTIWDGASIRAGAPRPVANFFVFEQTLRNGVYVAAGDLNGDGVADLIVGGGPGGGPRVLALDGRDLAAGAVPPRTLANFFAGDASDRGGVRVAVKDLDGDSLADLVTGSGAGGSRVTAYAGRSITPVGSPPALFAYDDPTAATDGVYVG